jgi:hypothetical protein
VMSALVEWGVIVISRASLEARAINYAPDGHSGFSFTKTLNVFFGARGPQRNNTGCEEFASPTFFRDALYLI